MTDRATKTFLGHLDDLRRAMIWSIAAIGIAMLVMIPLAPLVLKWLALPLAWTGLDPARFLRVLSMAGGMAILLRVVLWGGLLLATPFVMMAIAWFIFPGLTLHERRVVKRALALGAALFAAGVVGGYFLLLPLILRAMLAINAWLGTTAEFVAWSDYVAFAGGFLLALGVAYELPMVLIVLGYLGIVSSGALRTYRRHVIVAILFVAMLLPPADPLSLILMSAPLVLLYEGCIWVLWLHERRKGRAAEAPAPSA